MKRSQKTRKNKQDDNRSDVYCFNKGLQAHRRGVTSEAVTWYRRCIRLNKSQTDAIANLGAIYWGNGRARLAWRLYRYALNIKKEPNYYRNCSLIEWHGLSDFEMAFATVQEGVGLFPNDPGLLYQMALLLQKKGDFKNAIRCYEKINNLPEYLPEIKSNLGVCLLELGEFAEALKLQKEAHELKPDCPDIALNFAAALASNKKFDEAAGLVEKLQGAQKNRLELLLIQVKVALEKNDILRASGIAEKINTDYPDSPKGRLIHGHILCRMKDFSSAEKIFRDVLEENPNDVDALTSLAGVLIEKDRFSEVPALLKKAKRLKPRSAAVLVDYALTIQVMGSTEDAISAYRNALEASDGALVPLWSLWRNTLLNGDQEEAARLLTTILAHPDVEKEPVVFDSAGVEASFGSMQKACKLWQSQEQLGCRLLIKSGIGRPDYAFEKTIIMQPVGRAGSFLLQSYLDDHPEVINVPGAFLKDMLADSVVDQALIKASNLQDLRSSIELIFDRYEPLFDARSTRRLPSPVFKTGERDADLSGYCSLGQDKDRVLVLPKKELLDRVVSIVSSFLGARKVNARDVFLAINHTFHQLRHPSSTPRILFFHSHNPSAYSYTRSEIALSPADQLLIVREPLQALERWIAIHQPENSSGPADFFDYYRATIGVFFGFFSSVFGPLTFLKQRYVIKLEDLKGRPKDLFESFCNLYGIDFNECLLEPTAAGEIYHGISSTEASGRFDSSHLLNYNNSIFSDEDCQRLEPLLAVLRQAFGYHAHKSVIAEAAVLENAMEPFDFEKTIFLKAGADLQAMRRQSLYQSMHTYYRNMLVNLPLVRAEISRGAAFKQVLR